MFNAVAELGHNEEETKAKQVQEGGDACSGGEEGFSVAMGETTTEEGAEDDENEDSNNSEEACSPPSEEASSPSSEQASSPPSEEASFQEASPCASLALGAGAPSIYDIWAYVCERGFVSRVDAFRLNAVSKAFNDMPREGCGFSSSRWEHHYHKATQVIEITGRRSRDRETMFLNAPSYDLEGHIRFGPAPHVIFRTDNTLTGIYVGLLRGTAGTKLKTQFVIVKSTGGSRFNIFVKDKRGCTVRSGTHNTLRK